MIWVIFFFLIVSFIGGYLFGFTKGIAYALSELRGVARVGQKIIQK